MTATTADFSKPLELLRIADALGKLIDHAIERGAVSEAEFFAEIASRLMDSCFTPNADLRSHEPPRNSGEGTAVKGPMPLGEKGDAIAPA